MEIMPNVQESPYIEITDEVESRDEVESHDYAHRFNPHDEWHTYEMEWPELQDADGDKIDDENLMFSKMD